MLREKDGTAIPILLARLGDDSDAMIITVSTYHVLLIGKLVMRMMMQVSNYLSS